jgi:hypothetical protein
MGTLNFPNPGRPQGWHLEEKSSPSIMRLIMACSQTERLHVEKHSTKKHCPGLGIFTA